MSSNSFLVHAFLLVLFGCLQNLTTCDDLKLNAKDEIELKSLFESYNKPSLHEIKTIHGELYSCVDFYKQPAFDHPLLKNHSYRLEMMSNVSQGSSLFEGLWVNGNGCPNGTVPIRKYTKDQFVKINMLFQKLYPVDDPLPGRYRSCVHTQNGPHTFYGARGSLNIYNYPLDNSQYTAGYQIIRAGNDQFQFGWMTNPALYGDGRTRTFLSTKVEHTKCFNLLCGGFVLASKDVPIDGLTGSTTRGSPRSREIQPIMIRECNVWKLYAFNEESRQTIYFGFWPNEVLKGLAGPAEYLEWGGEAYNPNGLNGPGMGSNFFPTGRPTLDGYARKLQRYDVAARRFDLLSSETESYADDSNYYKIQDGGLLPDAKFGHIAYYGGPGKQA